MDKTVWQRADAVFAELLQVPSHTRESMLEQRVDLDPAVRELVQRLLTNAQTHESPQVLPPLVLPGDRSHEQGSTELPAGTQVGAFRVVHTIGEGGMSQVYLAERADGEFTQKVALKVLKDSALSENHRVRFAQEREVLASMSHPGIARLLDGGTDVHGRVYLAMEFVEGLPIDEYVRDNATALEDRVKLLIDLADAVAYAHQRLVVHRDIKPSNVLVRDDGQPVLLDFGISKLLDPQEFSRAAPETRAFVSPMTPGYVSPEQVYGAAITVGTDIYQIGLMMFELLTGARAQSIEGATLAQIRQQFEALGPLEPSQRVDDKQLRGQLQGDLDAIVAKCTAADMNMRYETALQLRGDLLAYLQHRPVMARMDATWRYRFARFLRRHRRPVLAGSVAGLAILSLGAYAIWSAQRTQEAQAVALREAQTSARVSDFLTQLLAQGNPELSSASDYRVEDLLDEAVEQIDEIEDEPHVRLGLLKVTAQAQMGLGNYPEAERLAAQGMQAALQMAQDHGQLDLEPWDLLARAQMLGPEPEIAVPTLVAAQKLIGPYAVQSSQVTMVAVTKLAALIGAAEYAQVKSEGETLLRTHAEQDNLKDADLSGIYIALAWAYQQLGEYDASLQMYQQLERVPPTTRAEKAERVGVLREYSSTLSEFGRHADARKALEQSITYGEEVYGERHPQLLGSHVMLAGVLRVDGERAAALRRLQFALDLAEETIGKAHPNYARTLHELARTYTQTGNLEAALAVRREAIPILQSALGAEHSTTVNVRREYAEELILAGDFEAGLKLMHELTDLVVQAFGENHTVTYEHRQALAAAVYRYGGDNLADLIALFESGAQVAQGRHSARARTAESLTTAYLHRGDYAAARQWNTRALEIIRSFYQGAQSADEWSLASLILQLEIEAAQDRTLDPGEYQRVYALYENNTRYGRRKSLLGAKLIRLKAVYGRSFFSEADMEACQALLSTLLNLEGLPAWTSAPVAFECSIAAHRVGRPMPKWAEQARDSFLASLGNAHWMTQTAQWLVDSSAANERAARAAIQQALGEDSPLLHLFEPSD